ncbi:MAG: hypothetical protein JOZ36_12375 [Acidobacteria bacterium]|nr:hypothetical protein [Acidobacteriota bacterium]
MPEAEKSTRSWREIAEEASREHDPEKLKKLSEELERALDERAKRLRPQRDPNTNKDVA